MFIEDRDMKMWSVVRKPPFVFLPISFCIIEGLCFLTSFCASLKLNIYKTVYYFFFLAAP